MAIAFDPVIAEPATILAVVVDRLAQGGVDPGDVTVVSPVGSNLRSEALPGGTTLVIHDPSDRNNWCIWRPPRKDGAST